MKESYELIDAYEKTQIISLSKIQEAFNNESKKEFPKSFFVSIFILTSLIFPLVVASNSGKLINLRIEAFLYILASFASINIFIQGIKVFKRKGEYKIKKSKLLVLVFIFLFSFSLNLFSSYLFYGNSKFKNFYILKAMDSHEYQYLAHWFYSEETINKTVSNLANKDMFYRSEDLIVPKEVNTSIGKYANKFEEALFSRKEGEEIYKIVEVKGTVNGSKQQYQGWLTIVYDPADVKLAVSSGAGTGAGSYGETLEIIHKKSNALVSTNAGGFYDPEWRSNGGIPHGLVVKDGEILTSYKRGISSGGLVGFNKENKLLMGNFNAEEVVSLGIRDAVDWGPFLIKESKDLFPNKKNYSWAAARTAIGQRADGIVLILVIDGMQTHSHGASYSDLSEIMLKYGAVNASCMDGGTSSAIFSKNKFLNVPFNGHQRTIRRIPNAWIVRKDEKKEA